MTHSSVPERREAPDVVELCRLAENATPGPWGTDGFTVTQHWARPEPWLTIIGDAVSCGDYCYGGTARGIEELADAEFIAAANPIAVLGLLDEADALRTELTHMREARDNARTEVERLTATVRRVRELHRESHGSLSALYPNPICECGKDYPCPTIRALDGGADA